MRREMHWPKTGATNRHAQLKLPDKCYLEAWFRFKAFGAGK